MKYNPNTKDFDYEVGEEIWLIPYRGKGAIAIRCEITEVLDFFRKESPTAILCYDIDVPFFRSVYSDDIMHSRKEAAVQLMEMYHDDPEMSLDMEQASYEEMLNIVWGGKQRDPSMEPNKIESVDWFNVLHIMSGKI